MSGRRGRGRPSLAARESLASTRTTTSNATTPAPSAPASGLKASGSRKSNATFEIALPSASAHSSERALRRSQYSMQPVTKRKRFEVGDSDDDADLSDKDRDAIVARRLQDEENHKVTGDISDADLARRLQEEEYGAPLSRPQQQRGRRSLRLNNPKVSIADSDDEDEAEDVELEDEDIPSAKAKTRGRGGSRKSNPQQPPMKKQKNVIVDSGDEDELAEPMEVGEESEEIFATEENELDSEDEVLMTLKRKGKQTMKRTRVDAAARDRPSTTAQLPEVDDSELSEFSSLDSDATDATDATDDASGASNASGSDTRRRRAVAQQSRSRRGWNRGHTRRGQVERRRLETHHPELRTMWDELEALPPIRPDSIEQPKSISRELKAFQLAGVAWMVAMEKTDYRGGLLGDEMGLGKTIQAVSLIMSDYPSKKPSLVLVPPVALMQWESEIAKYTDGTLKTFVFHKSLGNRAKKMTLKQLKEFDVIMMSYNGLEAMYRKQEKGVSRKDGIHKETSPIHQIDFHRIILDEAHCIKTRTTMTAKACFALKTDYRWCLTGTPLQNRIGEFFSLVRFLQVKPFASYLCKQCNCTSLDWSHDDDRRCTQCSHASMQHVSVFNQELLNPIQKFGNIGPGQEAFRKLRLMTDRIMLRRLKKDHTDAMELPVKEIYINRQFFGEAENDFANSIMTNGQRKFDTYVSQGVLLNNYANIFGLIMQMRQVADHPDLILRKHAEGGQNVLVCCICDEPAEDAIRSRCKHDFCRACARSYIMSSAEPDCPQCHINLAIDLEQPEIEQNEADVKKSSIINRIKMEEWTSSSKIELLVHELHKLRSDNASHKSIIFSQFASMLQLIEWRLRRAGITTVMLDGTMTPAQRQASINHFMTKTDCECFLVSLKAGGVALNLTEASCVFLVDPWWNPAAEWQSADRCHRIGQTRPCTITRLCIEDSVESRMVLIQEKKTSMINSTVNSDDAAIDTLSPEDMQFLFRGS
ncbi:DNA repair protein RAD16-like protein 2 [Colletotrichum chlorophyti]|uniref:DNA repair protein RAD16-like protein 2 n=1 Tax=Colletotrichum chlorophyti TaxID=708187 RepID=A0A1Q8RRF5_9PEZI|nr:DNA repair protein RAD16-like protein 2 [Colletotrichum chlorophyti]